MDLVASVIALLLGLACVGAGVRLRRSGRRVVTSTGWVWDTAGAAGWFWILLGLGLLTVPLLTLGTSSGVIGSGVGLWLGVVPILLGLAAVIGFRPYRLDPEAEEDEAAGV
jgi:hypothetical protein